MFAQIYGIIVALIFACVSHTVFLETRQVAMLDQSCLMRWLSARQLPYEGGFQGRTQKVRLPLPVRTAAYLPVSVELARVQLVDSCYSFWQASVPSLVAASLGAGGTADSATEWYNRKRLQQWLLCCCQDARGGLKDKPVYTHARAHTHTYTHAHTRTRIGKKQTHMPR